LGFKNVIGSKKTKITNVKKRCKTAMVLVIAKPHCKMERVNVVLIFGSIYDKL
jgi:hypothetical protein